MTNTVARQNRSSPKFARVISLGSKISSRYDYLFSSPKYVKCASSKSASFLRGGGTSDVPTAKIPAPISFRTIRQMNGTSGPIFLTGQKISAENALAWRSSCVKAPYTKNYAFGRGMLNRQVGVGDSKYGVIGEPLFTGHVIQPNFGPKNRLKKALT